MDIAGLDVRALEGGVAIAVKAVPGAKRDGIAGVLGTRLKVRVSAPPEDGRANAAICAVIAAALGVKPRAVTVVTGHASAEKVVRVEGVGLGHVSEVLKSLLGP
jgi:uncharacterized protein (TIGR00251 family)